MREHAPITLQRMLAIRQFAGFSDVDLAELATIAENVFERTIPAGATLVNAGVRFPGIYMVVRGQLVTRERSYGPRRLVGALEVIGGRPSRDAVIAAEPTQTLLLPSTGFSEILEDNYGVLSTTRRLLARQLLRYGAMPKRIAPPLHSKPLGIVERLIVLRAMSPLASANVQALSSLAHAAEEIVVAPGELVSTEGMTLLLDGQIRIGDTIASHVVLGGLEALAEVPHADAEAVTSVRALHITSAALFDVMEDHTDFALAIVRKLATELLDVTPVEVN
jgi:CRP-like cAMP-binding protein